MYPILRLAKGMWRARKDEPLPVTGTHISHHLCWLIDIDPWRELNNGRTLTLYDLGRLPFAKRIGMVDASRRNNWSFAVAGVSVRYRRRVRAMTRIEIRTRGLGWDDKFLYFEQAIFLPSGECANHGLIRMAAANDKGIVPPAKLVEEMGQAGPSPELPEWVKAWIAAENTRPWPPMQDAIG